MSSQLLARPMEELKEKWIDYISAIGGGLLDGWVLSKLPEWWILKNIALAVLSLFVRQIPDGFKYHSFGQLGFILATYFMIGR